MPLSWLSRIAYITMIAAIELDALKSNLPQLADFKINKVNFLIFVLNCGNHGAVIGKRLATLQLSTDKMKQTKAILQLLTLTGFLLVTSFKPLTNQLHISGKVYSDDKELNEQLVGLHLIVIADNKLVAQTFTEKDGHYELTFTPGNEKSFDFIITGLGIDTTLLKSFTTFESDVMTYNFKFPSYKKKLGQAICPKCEKSDKVYPIVYGDNQKVSRQINNSDTIYSNIVDKKYYAGTCVSSKLSPRYYCDRDKIKF